MTRPIAAAIVKELRKHCRHTVFLQGHQWLALDDAIRIVRRVSRRRQRMKKAGGR